MVHTLVVEDDRDTRNMLRLILEDSGYQVVEATDGAEALELLQKSEVSLVVLLDINLPRVDGIKVLQTVAQDGRLASRHTFIVMTALSGARFDTANELCTALSVPLIEKPFNVNTLRATVAKAARRLAPVPPEQA